VIPALFEASVMASKVCRSINIQYFYNLLFTTVNLKLVHIVCHDKSQHDSAKCDPKLYLEDEQVGLWLYSIPKEETPDGNPFLSIGGHVHHTIVWRTNCQPRLLVVMRRASVFSFGTNLFVNDV